MSEKEIVSKVMWLLRTGRIDRNTPAEDVLEMVMWNVKFRVTYEDGQKREYKTLALAKKWAGRHGGRYVIVKHVTALTRNILDNGYHVVVEDTMNT